METRGTTTQNQGERNSANPATNSADFENATTAKSVGVRMEPRPSTAEPPS
ncbi:hypothetical protein PC123_g14184 [Phytophthora cactorum]|nr:hypothetical protein PC123_g14184 [Phytophthora cactorum]